MFAYCVLDIRLRYASAIYKFFFINSFFFLSIFDTSHSQLAFIVLTVVGEYITNDSNLHFTGAAGAVSVLTGFD